METDGGYADSYAGDYDSTDDPGPGPGPQAGGAFINSGTYGCAFSPPLKCKKNTFHAYPRDNDTFVSKVIGKVFSDANALRWIQCFGWVHQDLHWENVVVDGGGIARIIDIAYMVKDVDFAEGGARNRMVEDDNALVTVGEHVVYYPPEYQSKSLVKSGWDRVDVYMLGRLMEHLGAFVKNPYFDQLVDRMIVDDPMTRPLLDEQSGVIAELEKIIEYEKFSDEIRMEKRPCLRDLSLSSERVSMTGMMMGSPSPSVSKSKSNSQEQGRGSASKRRLQFSSSSSRSPSSGPAVSRRLAMD